MTKNFLNNSSKIQEAAEKAVVNYFRSTGWKVKKKATAFKDIEAIKNSSKILVHVTTTIEPGEMKTMSKKDAEEFKSRASEIGADAVEAKVLLDKELEVKKMNFKIVE